MLVVYRLQLSCLMCGCCYCPRCLAHQLDQGPEGDCRELEVWICKLIRGGICWRHHQTFVNSSGRERRGNRGGGEEGWEKKPRKTWAWGGKREWRGRSKDTKTCTLWIVLWSFASLLPSLLPPSSPPFLLSPHLPCNHYLFPCLCSSWFSDQGGRPTGDPAGAWRHEDRSQG